MEPTVVDTALAETLAAQYPSMLSLDLRSNNIVSIKDLHPLSELRELALDDNRLDTLESCSDLQLLTSLSARSNLIADLGARVTALSSLRVLDLAWNRLMAGPWVHQLASLPHLAELDLRGNPVCDLEGSQQLLAAALPRLQRLNGAWLRPAEAAPQQKPQAASATSGPANPLPTDSVAYHPQRPDGWQDPWEVAVRGAPSAGRMHGPGQAGQQLATGGGWFEPGPAPGNLDVPLGDADGGADDGASIPLIGPTEPADSPRWTASNGTHPWAPQLTHLEQRRHWQGEPWAVASELGGWRPPQGPQQSEQAATAELQAQLEAAGRAQDALAAAHAGLVGERERLVGRTANLEDALQQAEIANARLQQQLQQQSTSSAAQVAGLASQVAALLAERDAAAAQAERLASQLAAAEGRADEAARTAGAATEQGEQLAAAERQLRRELAATQELMLRMQQQQQRQQQQQFFSAHAQPTAAGRVPSGVAPEPQEGSPIMASPRGGRGPTSRVEAALHQRVEALQAVVRMQERELVRMGSLAAGQHPGGAAASAGPDGAAPPPGPAAGAGWDNVLQPWREQVQALHEQVARLGAEGSEQRVEWGHQLGEMREQFTQARTLLEVLEQRLREQRSENSQLQARASQLGTELTEERQRVTGLEQQVAARDAAAQAVRRQLVAFKSHMEQREAELEARAEQLSAHAARLAHASRRLGFALSLAALRGRGQGPGLALGLGQVQSGPGGSSLHEQLPQQQRVGRPVQGSSSGSGPHHVALQGLLAASPAAKMAAGAPSGWMTWSPDRGPRLGLLPGAGGGGVGGAGAGGAAQAHGQADDGPVVAVLRQELTNLGRDREMLLRQLAQVSSAAEERIRAAQAAMQEREGRHREALVAARVQAAVQAAEAEAERKVQAAEAAAEVQAAEVRRQVAAALEAAEELCRRTEAAAGLRLSKAAVRLADLAKQVTRLRSAAQRTSEELRAARVEVERLRREVAAARASEADLRCQLAGRDREAHARVAELRAEHEEALAAERRRAGEAERLAAKTAAECGGLERQLARMREVRAQQDDARLRRLQSQVHEQEAQLRSLRRERNTLLAELRKLQQQQQQGGGGGGRPVGEDLVDTLADLGADTAALDDRGPEGLAEGDGGSQHVSGMPAAGAVALDPFGGQGPGRRGGAAGTVPVLPLAQRPAGAREAGGGGGGGANSTLIRSILRSGVPQGGLSAGALADYRSPVRDREVAAPLGLEAQASFTGLGGGAETWGGGTGAQAVAMVLAAGAGPTGAGRPVEMPRGGSSGGGLTERLSELEALTAELLSLD